LHATAAGSIGEGSQGRREEKEVPGRKKRRGSHADCVRHRTSVNRKRKKDRDGSVGEKKKKKITTANKGKSPSQSHIGAGEKGQIA